MIKKPKKSRNKNRHLVYKNPAYAPFIEHLYELRKRLLYIAISVIVGTFAAYFIQQRIVAALLRPSHGQQFIYTSPGGGINFLFQVCIYVGIALSIPVIVYQILRFVEPVIEDKSRLAIAKLSVMSGVLALVGIVFGYFMGLPIALNFLSHQFTTKQIVPLFTIQEYMSFVTFYLVAAALLFQIPLIIVFINRIKPLQPKRLFHYERYVIAGAFLISALMAPTINIVSQLIIAGPVIAMYQLAIALVWIRNRNIVHKYSKDVETLVKLDQEVWAKRNSIAQNLRPIPTEHLSPPIPINTATPRPTPNRVNYSESPAAEVLRPARPIRRAQLIDDVIRSTVFQKHQRAAN